MSDMPPDIPSGQGNRKWLIIGGLVLAAGGLWYYERQKSNSSNASTASVMDPYGGAAPGSGLLEPIIIQQPGGSPTSSPTPAGTSAGWYLTKDEANFLAHTTPAQRKTLLTEPSSKWTGIPGLSSNLKNWLAHLTPAQRQYLLQSTSDKWPINATATAPSPGS